MGRRKKHVQKNSVGLVLGFIIVVVILIGISLAFRVYALIKESRFDGIHRFTIALSSEEKTELNKAPYFEIISFAPDSHTISLVLIEKNIQLTGIGKTLEIPIDAAIFYKQKQNIPKKILSNKDVESILLRLLVSYRDVSTNLTIIDLARLWFIARSWPRSAVTFASITNSSDQIEISKFASSLFIETEMVEEKNTIGVVNGTDEAGLGNRLSRLITNMGGNVVSISTSDTPITRSSISYFGNKSYTVSRLQKVLGFKEKKLEKQAISDIIITIGKDYRGSIF